MSRDPTKEFHHLLKSLPKKTLGQARIYDYNSDSIESFIVEIQPRRGLYKHGKFLFQIKVGRYYPREPPDVICLSDMYHPNIDTDNIDNHNICLNLFEEWNRTFGLEEVIQGLIFLFYHPNLDDPISCLFSLEITEEVFKSNVRKFLRGEVVDDGYTFSRNPGWDEYERAKLAKKAAASASGTLPAIEGVGDDLQQATVTPPPPSITKQEEVGLPCNQSTAAASPLLPFPSPSQPPYKNSQQSPIVASSPPPLALYCTTNYPILVASTPASGSNGYLRSPLAVDRVPDNVMDNDTSDADTTSTASTTIYYTVNGETGASTPLSSITTGQCLDNGDVSDSTFTDCDEIEDITDLRNYIAASMVLSDERGREYLENDATGVTEGTTVLQVEDEDGDEMVPLVTDSLVLSDLCHQSLAARFSYTSSVESDRSSEHTHRLSDGIYADILHDDDEDEEDDDDFDDDDDDDDFDDDFFDMNCEDVYSDDENDCDEEGEEDEDDGSDDWGRQDAKVMDHIFQEDGRLYFSGSRHLFQLISRIYVPTSLSRNQAYLLASATSGTLISLLHRPTALTAAISATPAAGDTTTTTSTSTLHIQPHRFHWQVALLSPTSLLRVSAVRLLGSTLPSVALDRRLAALGAASICDGGQTVASWALLLSHLVLTTVLRLETMLSLRSTLPRLLWVREAGSGNGGRRERRRPYHRPHYYNHHLLRSAQRLTYWKRDSFDEEWFLSSAVYDGTADSE